MTPSKAVGRPRWSKREGVGCPVGAPQRGLLPKGPLSETLFCGREGGDRLQSQLGPAGIRGPLPGLGPGGPLSSAFPDLDAHGQRRRRGHPQPGHVLGRQGLHS